MVLKKHPVWQMILNHIEAQHRGSGEVESEDASDTFTSLAQVYQDGHMALTAKLIGFGV